MSNHELTYRRVGRETTYHRLCGSAGEAESVERALLARPDVCSVRRYRGLTLTHVDGKPLGAR